MSDISDLPTMTLIATYDSPSGSNRFGYTIPAPQIMKGGSLGTEARKKYVSELRASSKRLQEDINKFLTEKMEEDKKRAGQEGENGKLKLKSKDEVEEENYGEQNEEET